ncbi:hypothetical protein B0H12DRAFT_1244420 [Mycena haematopus]|nr:hypothetical protein B0H12DRAFT_1244420 [Mycena haematopus]
MDTWAWLKLGGCVAREITVVSLLLPGGPILSVIPGTPASPPRCPCFPSNAYVREGADDDRCFRRGLLVHTHAHEHLVLTLHRSLSAPPPDDQAPASTSTTRDRASTTTSPSADGSPRAQRLEESACE